MKIFNFLVRLDIWINVRVFNGNEGETISSRLGRKIEDRDCNWCRFFCRYTLLPLSFILILMGKQETIKHCRESIQREYK